MNKDNKNTEVDNTDKKLHISDVISSSSCCNKVDNIEITLENNSGLYGTLGVTKKIFKCKVCGKNLMF